nr:hypothetical transcript [Hymenolepis microstoma]CDS35093.1 hypothetical transcript [Hymenolepis microstoma]
MSLLPQQMADLGIRRPFFFPNSILNSQSTMFTPEQLDATKAATAPCGLIASLISHSQKKHLPSMTPPLPNTHRSSSLSTSGKSSIPSKKSLSSFFKRGARVRPVDGSIQKVEGLRIANFIRAIESLGTESNLPWVEVTFILKEDFLTEYKIRTTHQ